MRIENGYEIVTKHSNDGLIVQELYSVSCGVREQIQRNVMNTCEQQVRDALIALGWKPPC